MRHTRNEKKRDVQTLQGKMRRGEQSEIRRWRSSWTMTLNNHNNNQLPGEEKKIIKLPRFESPADGKQSREEGADREANKYVNPYLLLKKRREVKTLLKRDISHISLVKRPAPFVPQQEISFFFQKVISSSQEQVEHIKLMISGSTIAAEADESTFYYSLQTDLYSQGTD